MNIIYDNRIRLAHILKTVKQEIERKGIDLRTCVTTKGDRTVIRDQNDERVIREIMDSAVGDLNLDEQELVLLRATNDDNQYSISGDIYEVGKILDWYLPRYKDMAGSDHIVTRLPEGVVCSVSEATEMLLNEPTAYTRKLIYFAMTITSELSADLPSNKELEDLESRELEWLSNQNSQEEVILKASLNFSATRLREADDHPRLRYIAKQLPVVRAISELNHHSDVPMVRFVVSMANVLFTAMSDDGNTLDVESMMEISDLFSACRNFRSSIAANRDMALSVLRRINNGKPAYQDMVSVIRKHRGATNWGFDITLRRIVPCLKTLCESEDTRQAIEECLYSTGVLNSYKQHKGFTLKT